MHESLRWVLRATAQVEFYFIERAFPGFRRPLSEMVPVVNLYDKIKLNISIISAESEFRTGKSAGWSYQTAEIQP